MGKEMQTQVRVGGDERECTVWIEAGEFVIGAAEGARGEKGSKKASGRPGGRRVVKFGAMEGLTVRAGVLMFRERGELIEVELGEKAEAWLEAIANPRTRVQKLGVERGMKVCAIGAVEDGVEEEVAEACGGAVSRRMVNGADVVLFFAREVEELAKLREVEAMLGKGGAAWVLWPKGRKDFAHEDVVAGARKAGLTQTRSMGFSAVFTGLRLVRPAVKNRASPKGAASKSTVKKVAVKAGRKGVGRGAT